VSEKARNYADFMRICQIILHGADFGTGILRAMLGKMKNETKTVSYKHFAGAVLV